jgi:predicted nucleic acid-binding protein
MILDTNAISAMAENDQDILPVLRVHPQIRVPVIALGEYWHGILCRVARQVALKTRERADDYPC